MVLLDYELQAWEEAQAALAVASGSITSIKVSLLSKVWLTFPDRA